MALLSAYVLPHPPVIIPAVGKGQEKHIQATRDAFETVAKAIKSLKPDTIIIMSPHGDTYSDYVHISPKDTVMGDFSAFGSHEKVYRFTYDTALRNELVNQLLDHGIYAGTKGQQSTGVDHGALVPLSFIQDEYDDFDLNRISQSGLSIIDHVKIGK
ncbi:MAG: AmmeMemoRadiSam system protein A, partial [Bacillota bacterium]